jgi:tetratricopeptide (TPR) repeat protein
MRPVAATLFFAAVAAVAGNLSALAMTDQVRQMCQQAEQMINSRRVPEAIRLLNQAAQVDPSCAEVHGYLGLAYQNSGRTQQAIQEYQQALQLNPQMGFMNLNIGNCYLNLSQPDQARPYLQQYLKDNPNSPEAAQIQANIGKAQAMAGQNQIKPVFERGQAALNQKRSAEAIAAFQQVNQLKPDWAPGHFYLGYAYGQDGKPQQAITEFQTALRLDPSTHEQAVFNIASNYQSLGDMSSAVAWYERYLQENPGSPKAGRVKQTIDSIKQAAQKSGKPLNRVAAVTPAAGAPAVIPAAPAENSTPDYLASVSPSGRISRWPANYLPIRVFVYPGQQVPQYRDSYGQALSKSFYSWFKGSGNRVPFVMVNDPAQASLRITWSADPTQVVENGQPVESGLTKLSMTASSPSTADINGANVILLTVDPANGQPFQDDEMEKICLHEIGHALGLNGHSTNNQDVMFFSRSPTVRPSLTPRDTATIQRIYGTYAPHPDP